MWWHACSAGDREPAHDRAPEREEGGRRKGAGDKEGGRATERGKAILKDTQRLCTSDKSTRHGSAGDQNHTRAKDDSGDDCQATKCRCIITDEIATRANIS
jgi:hypothetical protein